MTLIGRYPILDAQTRDLLEQVCSCWSIIVPSNVDGVVVVGTSVIRYNPLVRLFRCVRASSAQDPSKRKLYVSNLDYRTTSDQLGRAFAMFGRIIEGTAGFHLTVLGAILSWQVRDHVSVIA